jgi:hypothetical protein
MLKGVASQWLPQILIEEYRMTGIFPTGLSLIIATLAGILYAPFMLLLVEKFNIVDWFKQDASEIIFILLAVGMVLFTIIALHSFLALGLVTPLLIWAFITLGRIHANFLSTAPMQGETSTGWVITIVPYTVLLIAAGVIEYLLRTTFNIYPL